MKKTILILALVCLRINTFSQSTYEVSNKSLNAGINNLIKTIITRDDRLTMSINSLRFVSSQDGKFLCTIKITTYNVDIQTSARTPEIYDAVLSEPVIIEANKDFKIGFDLIKGDIQLVNAENISVEITLTKINQSQENLFSKFLKTTLNIVSKGNSQIQNVVSILGIDQPQKDQSVKFEVNYYIPQSFAEFFNLGDDKILNELFVNNKLPTEYPTQSDGTPFIFNNIPVYIGIKHDFNNDGNVMHFSKDIVNQFTAWIIGRKALKNTDKDNVQINGFISLSFSKDYTLPLPLAIRDLIFGIENIAKRPTGQIDFEKAKTEIIRLDNTISVFDSKILSTRLRQNITLFVDILNIYLKYKQLSSNPTFEREGKISEIIGNFSDFFQSTQLYNSSAGLINLGVSGFYSSTDPSKTRYGIIYIPYGLPNSSTEFVTKVQSELHTFITSQRKTGTAVIKQLIDQNIDYMSYEK